MNIRNILSITLLSWAIAQPVHAQFLTDVPSKDIAYSAINKTIKGGYLPLYSDNTFQPDQPISRRELAIVIEKLLADSDETTLTLTKNDIQEVKQLLRSFKTYISKYDSSLETQAFGLTKVENEQKVINKDMTRFSDEWTQKLQTLKKEQNDQNLYLWMGVAAAAFFGLVIK